MSRYTGSFDKKGRAVITKNECIKCVLLTEDNGDECFLINMYVSM